MSKISGPTEYESLFFVSFVLMDPHNIPLFDQLWPRVFQRFYASTLLFKGISREAYRDLWLTLGVL